jgi:hypothetical protein
MAVCSTENFSSRSQRKLQRLFLVTRGYCIPSFVAIDYLGYGTAIRGDGGSGHDRTPQRTAMAGRRSGPPSLRRAKVYVGLVLLFCLLAIPLDGASLPFTNSLVGLRVRHFAVAISEIGDAVVHKLVLGVFSLRIFYI